LYSVVYETEKEEFVYVAGGFGEVKAIENILR
jgi:hypothetical protein